MLVVVEVMFVVVEVTFVVVEVTFVVVEVMFVVVEVMFVVVEVMFVVVEVMFVFVEVMFVVVVAMFVVVVAMFVVVVVEVMLIVLGYVCCGHVRYLCCVTISLAAHCTANVLLAPSIRFLPPNIIQHAQFCAVSSPRSGRVLPGRTQYPSYCVMPSLHRRYTVFTLLITTARPNETLKATKSPRVTIVAPGLCIYDGNIVWI